MRHTTDKELRKFLSAHPEVKPLILDGNHRVRWVNCSNQASVTQQDGAMLKILEMTPSDDAAGDRVRQRQREILAGVPAYILHPHIAQLYYERIAHCKPYDTNYADLSHP